MATITLTLPVAGTGITAGLHANNYTAIQTAVNGGLDNNNWASGRIFAPSKLTQEAAVDQNIMAWDNANTTWKPRAASVLGKAALGLVEVYDRITATTDVNTTLAETTLYTKTITGGDLGTNKMLRLLIHGDYLHNNVAADTMIVRIKYGATTLYASNAYNLGNVISATRHPYTLQIYLQNFGATNNQALSARLDTEIANTAAPTTGLGLWAPTAAPLTAFGIATEDSTADKTLLVTVQWSASSVNNSWRARGGVLELG